VRGGVRVWGLKNERAQVSLFLMSWKVEKEEWIHLGLEVGDVMLAFIEGGVIYRVIQRTIVVLRSIYIHHREGISFL
jgi:hypothetical protein